MKRRAISIIPIFFYDCRFSLRTMDRIAGIEIEYGCLVTDSEGSTSPDSWPVRVKNYAFHNLGCGLIDQHYRDYEEPPGNGGFLFNGGRLYLDMGHLEYSTPECLTLADLVAYEIAGDRLILETLDGLGAKNQVSFLKNNIDHFTGATFGCHENYLMRRDAHFSEGALGALLAFLATRQIYTGAGRLGSAEPFLFETGLGNSLAAPNFQMSQRADHMVNDIYQWVQFNRSIINARDEPLSDPRKYRRLHLLIGDSNMSPYAMALKSGTTALILRLLEERLLPPDCALSDAVQTTRSLSRDVEGDWMVDLQNGKTAGALDLQLDFLQAASNAFAGQDEETDWVLTNWEYVLSNLRSHPERLLGGVDWVTKKWLLEIFAESEKLDFDDPWMLSQDLEYHNIDPAKGLFFSVESTGAIRDFNNRLNQTLVMFQPPFNTRAAGRSTAMQLLKQGSTDYIINWDGIALGSDKAVRMPDPFLTYRDEVKLAQQHC